MYNIYYNKIQLIIITEIIKMLIIFIHKIDF
jgi:hypothetical protein